MQRSRVLFAITVAAAAMATTADAATVGVPGGPSVQVPDVKVPQLPAAPSLPKVKTPKVQAPQVKLPSAPSGAQGPLQRLGGSVPGGGGAGGGSRAAGSGAAGSSAGRSAGSPSGPSSPSAGGSRSTASQRSRGRPLTARQRRARDVRERQALRLGVQRLRGCLGVVSSFERQVLVLRSGVSGPEHSRGQVAQELETSVRRVQRGERSGLRGLRDAARSTGCSGGSAMAFSDSGSDQMASATVAVATGGAPSLRPVATMADSQPASVRTRPARKVLGVSADSASGTASPDQSRSPLTALPRTASVNIPDGSPSPLFLLFLLLLLVPLTIVALRRRPDAAGFAPAAEPGPEPLAALQPLPPPPPVQRAEPEPGSTPEPHGHTEPEHEESAASPAPAPAGPTPRSPATAPGRRRTVVGVAGGLISVALGGLLSRRFGRRRRR